MWSIYVEKGDWRGTWIVTFEWPNLNASHDDLEVAIVKEKRDGRLGISDCLVSRDELS